MFKNPVLGHNRILEEHAMLQGLELTSDAPLSLITLLMNLGTGAILSLGVS